MNEERLLTKKEVADILGIKERDVNYLCNTNRLSGIKGKYHSFVYNYSEVMALKEERENKCNKPPFGFYVPKKGEKLGLLYSYKPQQIDYPLHFTSKKYFVTTTGDILSEYYNRIERLTPVPVAHDYLQVSLALGGGESKCLLVHRLVAGIHCPNGLRKNEVHHIDFNRQNNYYNNLIWVTHEEHVKLHKLHRTGDLKSYNKLIRKIQRANEKAMKDYPVIVDDLLGTFYQVTRESYERYAKTGVFPCASEIIMEWFISHDDYIEPDDFIGD